MDYLTPEFSSAGNLWSLKCPPGCLQLLDTSVFLSSVSDFVINDQMFWFTNYWRVTTEKYTHRLSNVISLGNCAKPQNILFVSTLQSYKMLSGSYLQIGVVWRFISILASAAFLCTWLCEASVASEKCPTSLGISGDIWSISEKNSGHDFDNVRERGEERKKEKRERERVLLIGVFFLFVLIFLGQRHQCMSWVQLSWRWGHLRVGCESQPPCSWHHAPQCHSLQSSVLGQGFPGLVPSCRRAQSSSRRGWQWGRGLHSGCKLRTLVSDVLVGYQHLAQQLPRPRWGTVCLGKAK